LVGLSGDPQTINQFQAAEKRAGRPAKMNIGDGLPGVPQVRHRGPQQSIGADSLQHRAGLVEHPAGEGMNSDPEPGQYVVTGPEPMT
jgi:hypothetical protein